MFPMDTFVEKITTVVTDKFEFQDRDKRESKHFHENSDYQRPEPRNQMAGSSEDYSSAAKELSKGTSAEDIKPVGTEQSLNFGMNQLE